MSTTLPPIYLVGPMGAGKSTLGRYLGQQLGAPVPRFRQGDRGPYRRRHSLGSSTWKARKAFVAVKRKSSKKLTRLPEIVMATGGGAVLREAQSPPSA